ncbi:O-methyltransferase [Aliivibrio fischeri]|uniref:O-methyltransferase n=1 Tax=Aliivibrio fischeri TaxID=668 RepID=UPI00080DBB9E|nr:O-methyltransferase [Aliivibrio fischeri]OCH07066.1 hypothetical protein A6E10_04760 [Aliivibrio fischeri]
MANTGKLINYSTRPAKSIERKMLKDLLLRLFPFGGANKYKYVGFGAKYFSDFNLFHNSLHIDDMVSIEQDLNNKNKYLFNKPFSCIDMKFGKSCEVLPKIKLDGKVICWLDYDQVLQEFMLSDFATLVEKVESGSVLILSYNSHPLDKKKLITKYPDLSSGYIKKALEDNLSPELVPHSFDERGMQNKTKFSQFLRSVIHSKAQSLVATRNAGLDEEEKLNLKQVVYFDYADGAHMSTVGYMVYSNKDRENYDRTSIEELDFFKDKNESYEIEVPNLTYREVQSLLQYMPDKNTELIEKGIVSEKDFELFSKHYKYFPNFIETPVF